MTTTERSESAPTTVTDPARFLEESARRHPEAIAVIDGDITVDWAGLHARVGALVDLLTANGIDPGSAVAVYLPRSIDALVVIHALVRMSVTVAPLDVRDPGPRTSAMLTSAGIDVVVTSRDYAQSLRGAGVTGPERDLGRSDLILVGHRRGGGPATEGEYLLFTSGSTGLPKGVLLPGTGVSHFAAVTADEFALRTHDRVAAQSALTFDLSTFDIFGTASVGAAHVVLPDFLKAFPEDLVGWLETQRITAIYTVPTMLQSIADIIRTRHAGAPGSGHTALPALRVIAFAGEAFPERALAGLIELFPDCSVYNLYGPTETNVCTLERVGDNWTAGSTLSIGRAFPSSTVCIVEDDLTPTDGEGELVVAGPTVLRGYLIDGELHDPTIQVNFPDGVARRAYRTGDRASTGPDGRLYLHGRRDSQVKRRGYRIDLAGIEAVTAAVPGVRACACVATGTDNGEQTTAVTLFVETDSGADDAAVRSVDAALANTFPATQLPDRTVHTTTLPRNTRGKIDLPRLRSATHAAELLREDTVR